MTPTDPAAGFAAELARLGPYFAVGTHIPGQRVPASWRPLGTLLDSSGDLHERIEEVRSVLAAGRPPEAVEFRVAASVTHLGLAARLISPALGMATLFGRVPRMEPAGVRWQPVLGGPVPLSLPARALAECRDQGGRAQLAGELRQHLLNGPVRSLTELTAAMSVSRTVLQGNIASAISAATSMIATARPGLAARSAAISSTLLRSPELAGTWTTTATGFRRRSCCLIYRAAPAAIPAVCGDCILAGRRPGQPGSRR